MQSLVARGLRQRGLQALVDGVQPRLATQRRVLRNLQRVGPLQVRVDDGDQAGRAEAQQRVAVQEVAGAAEVVVGLAVLGHQVVGVQAHRNGVPAAAVQQREVLQRHVGAGGQAAVQAPRGAHDAVDLEVQVEAGADIAQAVVQERKTDVVGVAGRRVAVAALALDHVHDQRAVPPRRRERRQVGLQVAPAGVDVAPLRGEVAPVAPRRMRAGAGEGAVGGVEDGLDARRVGDRLDVAEELDRAVARGQARRQLVLVAAGRGVQPQAAHDAAAHEEARAHAVVLVGHQAVRPVERAAAVGAVGVDDVAVAGDAVGVVQLVGDVDVGAFACHARVAAVARGPAGEVGRAGEAAGVGVGGDQDLHLARVRVLLGVHEVHGAGGHRHVRPVVGVAVGQEVVVGDRVAAVGRVHEDERPLVLVVVVVDGQPVGGDEDLREVAGAGHGDRRHGAGFAHGQALGPRPRGVVAGVGAARAQDVAVVADPHHVQVAAAVDGQLGLVLVGREGRQLGHRPRQALVKRARHVDVAIGRAQVDGRERGEQDGAVGAGGQRDMVVVHAGGVGGQGVGRPGRTLVGRAQRASRADGRQRRGALRAQERGVGQPVQLRAQFWRERGQGGVGACGPLHAVGQVHFGEHPPRRLAGALGAGVAAVSGCGGRHGRLRQPARQGQGRIGAGDGQRLGVQGVARCGAADDPSREGQDRQGTSRTDDAVHRDPRPTLRHAGWLEFPHLCPIILHYW